jgi:hypothetical protein
MTVSDKGVTTISGVFCFLREEQEQAIINGNKTRTELF